MNWRDIEKMNKLILKYSDIREQIIDAVNIITEPIAGTLSPRGSNVICENDNGRQYVTNDGVTIAKNITVADPVKDNIIQIIKGSALQTNNIAGDGTSTTILLASILIKGGMKLLESGWNGMELKQEFTKLGEHLKNNLKKMVKTIPEDDTTELKNIARISANNDEEIADDVVKIVGTAKQDGLVFFIPGEEGKSEIIEDTGFMVDNGLLVQELKTNASALTATYMDVPVLVTDKKLYYPAEAETILKVCLQAGYKEVVIVAKDFIGEALPFFVTNHLNGIIKVLLVKEPTEESGGTSALDDLAIYLGGKVISEKSGSIVDKLTIEDFVMSKKVFSDTVKTVISRDRDKVNIELTHRVAALRKEIKKKGEKDSDIEKNRLAALTNGMVTVKIGGATGIEINERMYRYEDALNATRVAMKDGYLVGGGISIYNALDREYCKDIELRKVFEKYVGANIEQIALNCGLYPPNVFETINTLTGDNVGYNALTGRYNDLLEDGVIDPFKVTEMAIDNSISIANAIISSNYMVINDIDDLEEQDGKRNK